MIEKDNPKVETEEDRRNKLIEETRRHTEELNKKLRPRAGRRRAHHPTTERLQEDSTHRSAVTTVPSRSSAVPRAESRRAAEPAAPNLALLLSLPPPIPPSPYPIAGHQELCRRRVPIPSAASIDSGRLPWRRSPGSPALCPRGAPQASAPEPREEGARGPDESPCSPALCATDTLPASGPEVSSLQIFL